MLQILCAVPQGLYRRALTGFGDERRLCNHIHFKPASKTAAQQGQVQFHFVRRDTQDLRHHVPCQIGDLRRRPHLCSSVLEPHGAAERLHGGVCQVGGAVFCFDCFFRCSNRTVGVALRKIGEPAVAVQSFFETILYGDIRQVSGFAGAPFHRQLTQTLHGLVSGLRHHRHRRRAAVQLGYCQYFFDAGHGFDQRVIQALVGAADFRVHANACKQQSWRANI